MSEYYFEINTGLLVGEFLNVTTYEAYQETGPISNLKNFNIFRSISKINDVNITTYVLPPKIQKTNIQGFDLIWMSSIGVIMVCALIYSHKKRERF